MTNEIITEIEELKKEKNAIILAHNYQPKEIQEVADFVGDSLELCIKASKIDEADMIIFCGVNFMAETAAIISPNKKVLLPDNRANCQMADMISLICGSDVELCAECIRLWHSFSKRPFEVLMNIQAESIRSNGKGYRIGFTEADVEYKTWEAQIRHVFPTIEKFRSSFVSRHKGQLTQQLPIESTFGEVYNEAEDIELGTLYFMVCSGTFNVSKSEERKMLDDYRKMRNLLAHVNTLSFEQVEKVLLS